MNGHEHEYIRTVRDDGFVLAVRCACGMTPLDAMAELPILPDFKPDKASGTALVRYFRKITKGRVG